ncbi:MAG TPA: efflux RND transporter periplasmic adaptor subunit [Kofleriaceae bacterium]|jgi:HlyD family secretion protein
MTIARWIFAALIIAVVAMVTLSSLKPRPAPLVEVHTAKASKMSITRTVSGAGKLEPERKVNVSSNITGVLLELKVGIGSTVEKGQIIGQIDTSRYKAQFQQQVAQVRSAEADVTRARANASYLASEETRAEQLAKSQVASEAEVAKARSARALAESERAAAESRAKMAKAGLSEAQSALGWATLTAPVAGTVLAVNHRVGERVRGSDFAEDVILTLGSLGEVWVRLEVGEQDVIFIKPGQTATIEIDAFPDHVFTGKVIDAGRDAIVKNAGTENEVTSFPVWVALDEEPPRALSGMSAQVIISTESHADVVAVPIQAVTVRPAGGPPAAAGKGEPPAAGKGDPPAAGKGDPPAGTAAPAAAPTGAGKNKLDKVVFVLIGDTVKKRVVEVGLSSETHVEIVKGLAPGDVVVEGPYRTLARELQDEAQVAVAPQGGP